jgi:hypothetical protein
MTPDEQARLQAHTAEIAKILYRNTLPEALKSLETIEGHLRKQWIEIVGLQVAFFLSKKQREQTKDVPEQ